ncbi:Ca2+-transporting ATPase [Peptostreptococcaceae bacterium pGA-8]|nr:Ca2+-transporting ATPase [Peptostreptococcaceae bacterium pGA-8]
MYYSKEAKEVLSQLNSSTSGLTDEAVIANRDAYGENKLYEKKKKSLPAIFFEQFKDFLVIILIIAAIISMATKNAESAAVICVVLILNAVLGTVQYVKAEKSLDSLKNLSAPMAKVIRNGIKLEIPAVELVVGDIITLEAGDIVPGDGRIVDNFSLKVNESALTGESESVDKSSEVITSEQVALGDQINMVFSGSLVTYGRATVVVTAVGLGTELGKIARLMNDVEEKKTPLQVTMDKFSRTLSIGIIILCGLIFALNVYRGMAITDSMLFAVALAVAAIPEALSSIITISLAIGTSRMADENAIIKQLSAVEGLGSVSIICSDKTGTLTQNKMTVENTYCKNSDDEKMLLTASILCNDTSIIDGLTTGDPTETALVDYYMKSHSDYEKIKEMYPRIGEIPFDSDRKLMSTMHLIDGELVLFTKGALDVMLDRTSNLSEADKEAIRQINFDWSNQGLRVLAFAKKILAREDNLGLDDEFDLEFIGLMSEMDPPRVESAKAVADCLAAGIKPIMITGDHKVTASAIARKIGIMKDGDLAITGPELEAMSDDELMEKLASISVYARVSPTDKIRIVKAWQSLDNIVAMTGDGVNDAPALKNADVGVAMGITGTEVSKDAASMILTDDNFATIIKSVLNGRNIYANIKNAIKFLLSGNTAGIFVVLYAALTALPTPFSAVHLLFINLVTDSLPALAISMEPMNTRLIHEKPRPRNESILTGRSIAEIIIQGLLIGAATVCAFYIGLGQFPWELMGMKPVSGIIGKEVAMTMAFACLCLARLWHGFNSRGSASIFKLGVFTNIYTIGAFFVGAALLFIILVTPSFGRAFTIAPLSGEQMIALSILAIVPTILIQIYKIFVDRE